MISECDGMICQNLFRFVYVIHEKKSTYIEVMVTDTGNFIPQADKPHINQFIWASICSQV